MATGYGAYGTSQLPLAGAILCCTSIPVEQRTKLALTASQMGADIKLDLTSDVTHLVVGSINSAKYRYVAKCREDVKVLLPEWLDALREVWMEGEDVDVAMLERQYRLPTFYGLKICLTGFDDPEQRKYIQDTVAQNGAEYHGDLTKNVTHLIAAAPVGKKYEHAVNWRMKVVTYQWFELSRQRGMALDEECFHPTDPLEVQGQGAWDRRRSISPMLGKRPREPGFHQSIEHPRRKLRRSASSKMVSQSEAIWAGITAAGPERTRNEEDDWVEPAQELAPPMPEDFSVTDKAHMQQQASSHGRRPFLDEQDGIFRGRVICPHGFDSNKTRILRQHLEANGAVTVDGLAELSTFTADDLRQGYLVVPHDATSTPTDLPSFADNLTMVTNWWVERCLHGKALVDHETAILTTPFDNLDIVGFESLVINITGFVGIELLHVTKAIELFGARYDEVLTADISVMVCSTHTPNPEKLRFASDKHIPAVHATWLWDSIRDGQALSFDAYMINKSQLRQQSPASAVSAPTAPHTIENGVKHLQKQPSNGRSSSKLKGGPKRPGTLELSLSAQSTSPHTARTTELAPDLINHDTSQDAQAPAAFDGAGSLPLQDIHPNIPSPRRPSATSSTLPKSKSASLQSLSGEGPRKALPNPAGKTQLMQESNQESNPDSIEPAAEAESHTLPLHDTTQHSASTAQRPIPSDKDVADRMAALLASRRTATPSDAPKDSTTADGTGTAVPGRRKRRVFGRAQSTRSNASTAETSLSRQGSVAQHDDPSSLRVGDIEHETETVRRMAALPQPSQELGWDSPGAKEARERMIRAMGGRVEEGLVVLEGIGLVRDATREDGESALGVRERRRRRL